MERPTLALRARLHAARRGLGGGGRAARPNAIRASSSTTHTSRAAGRDRRGGRCRSGGYSLGGRLALHAALRDPAATPALVRSALRAGHRGPGERASARGRREARRLDGEPHRSRRSSRSGSASRCSPTSREALVEAQRPGAWPTTRASSRRCSAHRGPGRAAAGLGPARRLELPVLLLAGALRRALRRGRHGGWPRGCRAARRAIVEAPATRRSSQRPDAVAAALLVDVPRRALRLARRRRPSTPRPGSLRAPPSARRGPAEQPARARRRTARASPARRRANARRRRAGARRRCPTARRACSTGRRRARPRRAVRIAARARRSRRTPASFTFTASQAPRLGRGAHVVGAGDRLVGGDRHRHAARAPRPAPRASRRAARPARGRTARARAIRSTASSTVQAPFASSRSAGQRADRLAHRRDALDVVGQADLELEARVAVAQARLRARGDLLGGPGGQRAVDGDRVGARLAERPPLAARLEVELRHLHGGLGLRGAPRASARGAPPRRARPTRRRRARTARPRRSRRCRRRPRAAAARARARPPRRSRSRTARGAGSTGAAASRFTTAGRRRRAAARRRRAGGRCRPAPVQRGAVACAWRPSARAAARAARDSSGSSTQASRPAERRDHGQRDGTRARASRRTARRRARARAAPRASACPRGGRSRRRARC